jgi:hypothetical protein
MKKNSVIILAIIVIAFFAVTCGKNVKKDDPGKVVSSYIMLIDNGNIDKAIDMLANVTSDQKPIFTDFLKSITAEYQKHGGVKKVEILSASKDDLGINAKVEVKLLFKDGQEESRPFKCVKTNETWFIIP